MQTIVLGGGCFWCLEASYQLVSGVINIVNGYAGGHETSPTYESVSSDTSGHAEVVEIQFDESIISLQKILAIFWIIHDPTSLNRQGSDIGTHYRSAIFYTDENQIDIIKESVQKAQTQVRDSIVTQVGKLDAFYPAESYHQNYFVNHPEQAYCQIVINPKIAKLRHTFSELLA